MELDKIKEHWQAVGKNTQLNGNNSFTSRDPYLAILEKNAISKQIDPNWKILEVGCGDGLHTVDYLNQTNKEYHALEISESLISLAKQRIENSVPGKKIQLSCGSVMDITSIYSEKRFDCIISQRCLINLPTWSDQKNALLQLHSLLLPGGILLLTEGFDDELDNLNVDRKIAGLEEIKVVSYNRNFNHGEFDSFISEMFSIENIIDYGFYLWMSRVFHPVSVRPNSPAHDSELNKAAQELSEIHEWSEYKKYSYNLLYVLKKK